MPSPIALRAFEAAARHESFKRAAEELFVTPAAVSHQIKLLEQDLGRALFTRTTREVRLTETGHMLFDACHNAFGTILDAVARCRDGDGRTAVTIGLGPLVGARWLSPRLPAFWSRFPDIDLRLHHTSFAVDFRTSAIDLGIAWGFGDWPDIEANHLLAIGTTPVLSPELANEHGPFTSPSDLLSMRLLHQRDHQSWVDWFRAAGVTAPGIRHGTVIEDSNVLLQSAIAGQGVALGHVPFIGDGLLSGRLVQPFDLAVPSQRAYYLIFPRGALRDPDLRAVHDWLLEEASA
ncbi:MAG: transcriptional regulator GcvA [Rhodospirillales bacterium]|nr:transcriptional regulator GcvA [Rhodospirillales bacterium]